MGDLNPFDSEGESSKNPFEEDEGDKTEGGTNPFGEDDEDEIPQARRDQSQQPPAPRPRATGGAPVGQEGPRRKKSAAPQPPGPPQARGPPTTAPQPPSLGPPSRAPVGGASLARSLLPGDESVAQHHELFLQEIEAVDEYWGPTFRWGGGAAATSTTATFLLLLQLLPTSP